MAQHDVLSLEIFGTLFTGKSSLVMMLQIVFLLVTHFLEYFCTDFILILLKLGSVINLVNMFKKVSTPHKNILGIIKGTDGPFFRITEGWEDIEEL